MRTSSSVLLVAVQSLAAVVAGCGAWVDFPDDYCDRPENASRCAPPTKLELPETGKLGHYSLAAVMGRYTQLTSDGELALVDYDGIAADVEARFQLDQYLALVATVDPAKLDDPAERLALFANAYNASVVVGIITRACDDTGCDATFSTIDDGGIFFNDPFVNVGGQTLTLDQLEHGAVRGDFSRSELVKMAPAARAVLERWHQLLWQGDAPDARLHAIFNCGALGCPNLPAAAPFVLRGDQLEDQLEQMTRAWLDSERKGAGAGGISTLFDWYTGDFEASHGSVEKFIAAFRTDGTTGVDLGRFIDYDWTLNSVTNAP